MSLKLPDWIDADARRTLLFLLISGVALALSFFPAAAALPFDPSWVAIVLCGLPILKEAAEGLFTRFDIKADVLVSMALIASVVIGETFAAGEIAWIMTIGSLLEELTVEKARAASRNSPSFRPRRRASYATASRPSSRRATCSRATSSAYCRAKKFPPTAFFWKAPPPSTNPS